MQEANNKEIEGLLERKSLALAQMKVIPQNAKIIGGQIIKVIETPRTPTER